MVQNKLDMIRHFLVATYSEMEEILDHLMFFPIIFIMYNAIIESVSQLIPILPTIYQLVGDFVHP